MIIIHPYNPDWPLEFERIRAHLAEVLGPLALRIDHIGSTSVPGLGAKDVIDIQVTVAELSAEVIARLTAAGYPHRADVTHDHIPRGEDANPLLWEKLYFSQPEGSRPIHIHVRRPGAPNQRYPLLFRDYLRDHPKSAQTVELIKSQLARYFPENVEAYYDIKDPVYDLIWDAAQDWARQTDWEGQGNSEINRPMQPFRPQSLIRA